MATQRQVVLWLSSGAYEARARLGIWVLTAASVGDAVHVVLAGQALHQWCSGSFDVPEATDSVHARASGIGLPPPSVMVAQAKELSAVRVVACSTEVLLAGLTEEEARMRVDEIVSLPSFWRETADARLVTVA